MIRNRLELHAELQRILVELGGGKAKDVYYQPPESVKMEYPAIVYELGRIDPTSANNNYIHKKTQYQITFITKNPDSQLIDAFLDQIQFCSFSRSFKSENLNHYVYNVASYV